MAPPPALHESGPRTILGLGELVWDEFPSGRRLGGAPANVAYHATALGDRGRLATAVGDDPAGREALAYLAGRGVDTSLVRVLAGSPTGIVHVVLGPDGPTYEIDENGAWRRPAWSDDWAVACARADAVCYGTLLCASAAGRTVVERARQAGRGTCWVLDVNMRPPFDDRPTIAFALAHADVVKANEDEAARLEEMFGGGALAPWLLDRGARAVVVTAGARGAAMWTRAGHWAAPAAQCDTAGGDPVGAGDAFVAAFLHHYLRDRPPLGCLQAANLLAAWVASRPGAMPDLPETWLGIVVNESGAT